MHVHLRVQGMKNRFQEKRTSRRKEQQGSKRVAEGPEWVPAQKRTFCHVEGTDLSARQNAVAERQQGRKAEMQQGRKAERQEGRKAERQKGRRAEG